ncbi:MAG: fibronectin type III domain-containing protein, partial [Bacteroidota bacterium]
GSYTITDRIPGQTYTLRVCAECTAGQPQCRDLEPFGGCPADYLPELVALDFKRALVGYAIEDADPAPTELRYGMRSFANWNPLRPGTFVDFNPESYPLPADQLAETEKLQPGVVYLAELRNQCFDTLWSAWSPPVEFSISCAANEELYASEITDSSALIASLPIPNASYYQFYYRLADSGEDWTLLDNVPSFATPITGLLADTTYEVKMRFWCMLGVWSNFSPVLTFRTLPPCRPPAELSFSNVTYASFDLNWEPGENAEETTFRYRRVRRSVFPRPWREITFAGNTGTIDGLREGAIYEIIGSSDCGVNTSLPGVRDTVVLACAPPEIALTEVTIEETADRLKSASKVGFHVHLVAEAISGSFSLSFVGRGESY